MRRGFIKLYRKIDDHPFYKEKRVFSKYEAWLDILKDVQHKAEETEHVIGMNVIKCSQGQSIKSLRTWGDKWGWTAKKVSRFFNLLEKMNQIRQENVTVTTRITVLNYLKYNGLPHTDDTDVTHNGNTSETQVKHGCPTDKNDNNVNNENNIISVPLNDGSFFTPDEKYINQLKDTYKHIDIASEFKNIVSWCIANPKKQKTPNGVKRFINSWMSRNNEKQTPKIQEMPEWF